MFVMFGRKKRPAYDRNYPFGQAHIRNPYNSPVPGFPPLIQRVVPFEATTQPMYWNPYSHQQQYAHAKNPLHPSYGSYQNYANPHKGQQSFSHMIFQNPLQPVEDSYPQPYSQQMNPYPTANPYPKLQYMEKKPAGFQSIMNSFKAQDGTIDFNKMINTAGQMMNAVTQVSSMVKGLGGMFKA
jgi:YppG-like protein